MNTSYNNVCRSKLGGRTLAFLDESVEEGADATADGDVDVVAVLAVERGLQHETNAYKIFAKG